MKKALLLTGALLCCSSSVWAFDVHFFANEAATPAKSVENATKIIFGDNALTVVNAGGESVNVDNSLFDYFKLNADASSVAELESGKPSVSLEGKTLIITADNAVEKVAIYAIDGKMVKNITPSSEEVTISLDNLTPGLYVVSVESACGKISKKLIID